MAHNTGLNCCGVRTIRNISITIVISDQQLSAGLYYGLITERKLELAMQKKRVPEKRYRELTDQGLRQMIREGRYEDAVRVTTKFTQRTITRSFKSLLAKLPEPTLDKRSYETLREIILGIVKKKVPGATTPPPKSILLNVSSTRKEFQYPRKRSKRY